MTQTKLEAISIGQFEIGTNIELQYLSNKKNGKKLVFNLDELCFDPIVVILASPCWLLNRSEMPDTSSKYFDDSNTLKRNS